MPAIGPQYLPIRVIADCRCFTSTSGLTCAEAIPAAAPKLIAMPAATTVFVIRSPRFAAWAASGKNTLIGSTIPSAQPGGVLGDGADLPLGHARGHPAHHAIRVVGARAFLERFELGGNVLGVLAPQPRVLRRHASARRTVASRAGGDAARGVAPAPELLAGERETLVGRGGGLELLACIVGREILHVGVAEIRHHALHHRALAHRLLAALRLEIGELLVQVLGDLARDLGIGGSGAVAVGGVARGAHLIRRGLRLRQVLRLRAEYRRNAGGARQCTYHPLALGPMGKARFY